MPLAKPSPPIRPSTAPSKPSSRRLADDRAEHLPTRGAERAQHAELARALGDGDRERVEDQEGADEQRHAREHEQDDRQEGEVAGDLVRLALGVLLGRSRPAPASGMTSRMRLASSLVGDARRPRPRRSGRTRPLVGDPLRLGQRQLGDAGAAKGVVVAERGDADQPVALDPPLAGDVERVADARGRSRSAVCLSIVASLRGARRVALLHVQRLEALGRVRGDEVRGEAGGQRVAVLLDELAEREDRARGRLDAVHAWRMRSSRSAEKAGGLPSSCSTSVWPVMTTSVPLSESEKIWSKELVDRVREHERARDQRDPEEDREEGGEGAQLARRDPAQRDLGHG